jgi:L-idonate 5-dehydrogenase
LAVTLHAVAQSGEMLGRKVLVTGAGPIGVLVVAAARLAGASEIIASDLVDEPLAIATAMGATRIVNVGTSSLEEFATDGGYFDVSLEASGNSRALESCIEVTRPGGRIVQVGILPGGKTMAPLNKVTAKELELIGTFRFHEEYEWAVDALITGRINVDPILSEAFEFAGAVEAFDLASDRRRAMKVSLVSAN